MVLCTVVPESVAGTRISPRQVAHIDPLRMALCASLRALCTTSGSGWEKEVLTLKLAATFITDC